MPCSFDYAVVRVVPRVERQEFLNAGVIVYCLELRFLRAEILLDRSRLLTLWPALDFEEAAAQLQAVRLVSQGDAAAGPIARLPLRERFHWLVAPRSTMIQMSPVHTGLSENPEETLQSLYRSLVLTA